MADITKPPSEVDLAESEAVPESARALQVFDLIVRYAERQGWIPIGCRRFTVGDWAITVNGSRQQWEQVPPFHAFVENTRYVGCMLMSPAFGGVAGYQGTESDFIADMTAALAPSAAGPKSGIGRC